MAVRLALDPVLKYATRLGELSNNLVATPSFAVTANAMPGERERCLEAGMDGFLTKPLTKGDLHALLLRHISPEKVKRSPVP